MKSHIYNLAKAVLNRFPIRLINKINTVYNLDTSQTLIFERYLSTNSPTCLLFNSGEKRPGCLTVGYEERCDIKLEKSEYIRLDILDKSFDIIEIDLFIEKIESDDYFWEFFRELGRLIKKDGEIKIRFLDLEQVLKRKQIPEEFWNIKRRFLYSKDASIFNSAISYIKDCKRIVDYKTLENMADLLGFNINKQPLKNNLLIKEIIISKNEDKFNQWKLTSTLPKQGEIGEDIPIYLFNCDPVFILENLNNIELSKIIGKKLISVIGSLFFLNFIPILKPKDIILFDINPFQVRYMKMIVEIILQSNSFENFLEKFFSRKFNKNIEVFLSQPKNQIIQDKVRESITDKDIYDVSIKKVAEGKYLKLNNVVPVIKIEDNSMCQHVTIVNKEYFRPGPRINVINTKWGLGKNFSYIQSKLKDIQVIVSKLEDKSVLDNLDVNSIIYVSNIGEEDWLNGKHSDISTEEYELTAKKNKIIDSFKKQWVESVVGYKEFIATSQSNFWIIDSTGNIFPKNELLLERSDSHTWLWSKLKPKIIGTSIEVIHKRKETWGFKEYLKTINYKQYIKDKNKFNTVILHILLGNGIAVEDFIKVLLKASETAIRIIIMEHDRDSINFGSLSNPNIVDIRTLIDIIRKVELFKKAEMKVEWSGASKRIDKNLYDDKQNNNRNIIITLDL